MAHEGEREPFTHSRQALVDGRPVLVYSHCCLSVTGGPDAGLRLETERDLIRIGQAADNDVVVHDPSVSRHHCEIQKRAGEFRLVDLDSTNGIHAGSLRIEKATLAGRTEFRIGDSTLLFEPRSTEVVVEPSGASELGEMVGTSVAMREIFSIIERVAPTELAILVSGETGTGKEMVARALHERSRRKDGPFITLALGALPPALLESALFGHERGAVPGADATYAGAFERASGGTLFLDELEQLPPELQSRLLRAVERGEIQRLRGDQETRVDVRVIAASSADLSSLVEQNRLRADLFYRLAVIRIDLPALRERPEDIPPLVERFFAQHAEELRLAGSPVTRASSSAMTQLLRYAFPGNVRELFNMLRRAAILAKGPEILVSDLPPELTGSRPIPPGPGMPLPDASMPFKDAKAQVLDAFERQYLADLLVRHRHNISKAAREAGIDRRHLYRLLDKCAIEVKDREED
ncbi:MAG: sigma 54-dependent Fis family transcriptional regulator [Deltaproteobacteria bacterium]|nr:sigma 54-dependent Fis family transcriptional regulator [Deltaproteobacteria bacterium]